MLLLAVSWDTFLLVLHKWLGIDLHTAYKVRFDGTLEGYLDLDVLFPVQSGFLQAITFARALNHMLEPCFYKRRLVQYLFLRIALGHVLGE